MSGPKQTKLDKIVYIFRLQTDIGEELACFLKDFYSAESHYTIHYTNPQNSKIIFQV